ncbi:MAG: DNA polymerase III subunit gamma/tau [Oscillospiraceae bacterium]|nr:DNA polymerase III subunit gamma/tau [Oscillospiraceae bacterium]
MYQALYRKWRPKTFDDVVGQEHITETLKNQVAGGRLSHAYLFIGTRGTGKTTCAKILAKAVNCLNPVNGNPCNRCSACLGIDDGSIMDVVEMDAASNNGVDHVRALRDEAVFSPASVAKRVYIVDEVHMMSNQAFNALLKILEEPPEHLMFILATTELHKVPATILSRCQRHSFKRLDNAVVEDRLMYVARQEGLDLRSDAAALIAGMAEGGMRDALSMLDQCSGRSRIDADTVYSAMGLAGRIHICDMLRHILNHDTASAIDLFTELWQGGKDPATLLGELSSLHREILMCIVAPRGGRQLLSGCYDERTLRSFAGKLSTGELVNNINILQSALADTRSGQARTVCELCLITLCESDLGDDIPLMRQRIAKLEKELSELKQRPAAYVPQYEAPPAPPAPAFEYDIPVDDYEGEERFYPEERPAPPQPVVFEEEEEAEYVPDTVEEGYDEEDIFSQLPPIDELPPLPGDEDIPPDPRSALMSFSAQMPSFEEPKAAEEEEDELDVPSFMREKEEERPRGNIEIKRKVYLSEENTPIEERDVYRAAPPAAPIAAAEPVKAPEISDAQIWEKTKAALSGNMPFGLYLLLTDPTQVDGFVSGSELTLSVKSSFALNMLNRPDIVAKVASAATSIAGRMIAARIVDADKAPSPVQTASAHAGHDKLDELGKFEIVSFK